MRASVYWLGMKSISILLTVFALLFVGCGKPNLDDPDSLNQILEEALDLSEIQIRGKEGEEQFYATHSQKPFTGWVKIMYENGQVERLHQFKDGKQHGLSTHWDNNGNVTSRDKHKNGVEVE